MRCVVRENGCRDGVRERTYFYVTTPRFRTYPTHPSRLHSIFRICEEDGRPFPAFSTVRFQNIPRQSIPLENTQT